MIHLKQKYLCHIFLQPIAQIFLYGKSRILCTLLLQTEKLFSLAIYLACKFHIK